MTFVWTLFFIVVISCSQVLCVAKQCTSQGKFPNDQDNSCVGYTMCLIAAAGNFAEINLKCPNGFIFNHQLNRCTNVTSYQCQPEYNCIGVGYFPNPYGDDCDKYIACVEGFNDLMTARSVDCPENFIFNPDVSTCVNVNMTDFKCNFNRDQDKDGISHKVAESTENSGHLNMLSCSIMFLNLFMYLINTQFI